MFERSGRAVAPVLLGLLLNAACMGQLSQAAVYAGDTCFYTAYIVLSRLLKVRNAVCQTAVSAEWDKWAHKSAENKDKSKAVKEFITGSKSDELGTLRGSSVRL